MASTLTTVKCPKPWRFTVMEWNLIKAYLMDWNTKRYFEAGDTFVTCYVQPQVWQLLELFGDGSGCESLVDRRGFSWEERIDYYFNTRLTVGKLIELSHGDFQRYLEKHRGYESDINAWSHLMCQAYDATPVENVYTMGACAWSRGPVKREAPTSVLSTQPSKGKVGVTPVWCSEARAEKVEHEGNYTVSVTRPVDDSNLSTKTTDINKHVLNFCPLREEYGGHGHLHTGAFPVEVLGHGKIHNDYCKNPYTVSKKELCEIFGDDPHGTREWKMPGRICAHPTIIPPSCLKPWSEDMVTTVEKVDYDFKMIRLKVQKVKYLWNVEVTNDGEGNTKIQAVEYPDPSTKYPNGVVMTRIFKVPIVKTEQCWRVSPYCDDYIDIDKKNWNGSLHGIEKLLATECIRKKGQKRPATRPSWMN